MVGTGTRINLIFKKLELKVQSVEWEKNIIVPQEKKRKSVVEINALLK